MERKTIGTFISVLRKARGLTQRQLAEMLNVSDKTVSRWERDEGCPDLSLIPVLAEIFAVSCDELLLGERLPGERSEQDREKDERRSEKQRQYLLASAMSRFRNRSLCAGAAGGDGGIFQDAGKIKRQLICRGSERAPPASFLFSRLNQSPA